MLVVFFLFNIYNAIYVFIELVLQVEDPYRWLEDPDSVETQEFVQLQNEVTTPFLQKSPVLSTIKARLTELWNFPKYSCPMRQGNRYFFYKNTGLQNHRCISIHIFYNWCLSKCFPFLVFCTCKKP